MPAVLAHSLAERHPFAGRGRGRARSIRDTQPDRFALLLGLADQPAHADPTAELWEFAGRGERYVRIELARDLDEWTFFVFTRRPLSSSLSSFYSDPVLFGEACELVCAQLAQWGVTRTRHALASEVLDAVAALVRARAT